MTYLKGIPLSKHLHECDALEVIGLAASSVCFCFRIRHERSTAGAFTFCDVGKERWGIWYGKMDRDYFHGRMNVGVKAMDSHSLFPAEVPSGIKCFDCLYNELMDSRGESTRNLDIIKQRTT